MSIVGDYAAIGAAYHALSDGWLPRKGQPTPVKVEPPHDEGEPSSWKLHTDRFEMLKSISEATQQPIVTADQIKKTDPQPRSVDLSTDYGDILTQVFDRYNRYLEYWLDGRNYFCPSTGVTINVAALDIELSHIERHHPCMQMYHGESLNRYRFRDQYHASFLKETANLRAVRRWVTWDSSPYKIMFELYICSMIVSESVPG